MAQMNFKIEHDVRLLFLFQKQELRSGFCALDSDGNPRTGTTSRRKIKSFRLFTV
jgi:hypothetical protein